MKRIETLEDLTPDDRNANRGTPRGSAALEESLRRFGAGRSILADRNGRVIAGNKTLIQAAELGLGVQVVETDGTRLVVVVRDDVELDSPIGRELAIADNRVAELNLDWDPEVIGALAEETKTNLFSPDEIRKIMAPKDPIDDPGLARRWAVSPGQVWTFRVALGGEKVAAIALEMLDRVGMTPAMVAPSSETDA